MSFISQENRLVYGDFNEFNILLTIDDSNIVFSDFPQMIGEHKEAENYFKKDIKCVKKILKLLDRLKRKKKNEKTK